MSSDARVSVGHPVDVASGSVFTAMHDFFVPGLVDIDWRRFYSTTSENDSWLGRGWAVLYFMTLQRTPEGYVLIDEEGSRVLFPTGAELQDVDAPIVNLGAKMELRRIGNRFEILHWHHGDDAIQRFLFAIAPSASMPLVAVQDVPRRSVTIAHDSLGRPVRLTQSLEKRTLELSYGRDDLIAAAALVTRDGQRRIVVRYEYDDQRRLMSAVNAAGAITKYEYDARDRMIAETNALGSTFVFQYDDLDRCTFTSGDGGFLQRTLQYRTNPARTVSTDSLGFRTIYYLNDANLVVQQVAPIGSVTTTAYDGYGRTVAVTDPAGATVEYEYDDRGNRTAVVNEDGGRYSIEYNDTHQITRITDPMGAISIYDYDDRGMVRSLTNAMGAVMACVRDNLGIVVDSIRAGGRTLRRRYAIDFSWQEQSDDVGLISRSEYDAFGNEIARYDAAGLEARTEYDVLNRPVRVEDATGVVIRLRWNAANLVVERNESGGGWERWEYDSFGQLTAHETAVGTMRLEYDTEESLLAVTNRAGERLERTYDAGGRITSQRFFDGRVERYEYDLRDMRTRIVKSDGKEINQHYDLAGFLKRRVMPDGAVEILKFDKNARLVSAVNPNATVEFERDPLGHVTAETQNGNRMEFAYDIDNNRVLRRFSDGYELEFEYDGRGRLAKLGDRSGTLQELRWDAVDRLVERRLPGAVELRVYNGARNLEEQMVSTRSGNVLLKRRYSYDDRGNPIARSEIGIEDLAFQYDAINRLVETRRSGRVSEVYQYDPIGTIVEDQRGARLVSPGGRVSQTQNARYHYDAAGCVAEIEGAAKGKTTLEYDADGNLVGAHKPDGSTVVYGFDAVGRRVSKDVDGKKVEFQWQGRYVSAELRQGTITDKYFFLDGEPLIEWHNGAAYYPIWDNSGMVRELVDSSGQLAWRAKYDAYGSMLSAQGAPASPLRFRGQYCDTETGFHYNCHRTFDPDLCDYLSPDPLGLTGGSNFYAYPRNPLRWDDPFGLTCGKNKCKGDAGEAAMEAEVTGKGYKRIDTKGRPRGIDAVFEKSPDDGNPPKFIIGESKFGSAQLGDTVHSGEQMSDKWIDTGIGKPGPTNDDRLTRAVGANKASEIQAASTTPGNVQKQTYNTPDYGKPAQQTGSSNYTYNSGNSTW